MTEPFATYYDHRCHQILPCYRRKSELTSSENDRNTFRGYLRYQNIDPTTAPPEMLKDFREAFEEWQKKKAVTPKPGQMKLRDLRPGEYRYAVGVREGADFFMTLFIRRDPKGDVYVMIPRGRGSGNPHASYHRDGTFHQKNYDQPMMPEQRQPIKGFKDCEHLGMYGGHGPKDVGVTCDTAKFTGIVEVPDQIFDPPSEGFIAVDLVEPGCENQLMNLFNPIHSTHVFKEAEPWLVIRVGKSARSHPPLEEKADIPTEPSTP
jgi:hypothetical protein